MNLHAISYAYRVWKNVEWIPDDQRYEYYWIYKENHQELTDDCSHYTYSTMVRIDRLLVAEDDR